MAFLLGQIVGINARSLYISLSTLYSMSGLADSRVFCVRICWSALHHRDIRMDRWSRRLSLRQRNYAPNEALAAAKARAFSMSQGSYNRAGAGLRYLGILIVFPL